MLQSYLKSQYGLDDVDQSRHQSAFSIMVTEDEKSPARPAARPTRVIRASRSSADTPTSNRNVIQFFQLVALHADGIQDFIQRASPGVTFTADDASNAFIIEGPARAVATAVDLLNNLDKPAFAGAQVINLQPIYWSPDNFAQALATTLSAEGYIVGTDPLGPKSIMIVPLDTTNQDPGVRGRQGDHGPGAILVGQARPFSPASSATRPAPGSMRGAQHLRRPCLARC